HRGPGGGPGGGDRQRHRGGGGGNQQDQGEGGDRCFHRDGFSDSTRTGRARGPGACAAGGAARGRCADIMHATGSGLARVRRGRFARIGGRRPGQGRRRGGQERFEYRRARGQAATGNGIATGRGQQRSRPGTRRTGRRHRERVVGGRRRGRFRGGHRRQGDVDGRAVRRRLRRDGGGRVRPRLADPRHGRRLGTLAALGGPARRVGQRRRGRRQRE